MAPRRKLVDKAFRPPRASKKARTSAVDHAIKPGKLFEKLHLVIGEVEPAAPPPKTSPRQRTPPPADLKGNLEVIETLQLDCQLSHSGTPESSAGKSSIENDPPTCNDSACPDLSVNEQFIEVDCVSYLLLNGIQHKPHDILGYSVCIECGEMLSKLGLGMDISGLASDAKESCRFIGSNMERFSPMRQPPKDSDVLFSIMSLRRGANMQFVERYAWYPSLDPDRGSSAQITSAAEYSVPYLLDTWEKIEKEENDAIELYGLGTLMIQKSVPNMMRESCDVCKTSIFNLHFVCVYCAFSFCPRCREDTHSSAEGSAERKRESGIWSNWIPCTSSPKLGRGKKKRDLGHVLFAATLIPGWCYTNASRWSDTLSDIQKNESVCVPSNSPNHLSRLLNNGLLYFFESPSETDQISLAEFRYAWGQGHPVVIANVTHNLKEQWGPEAFMSRFGEDQCLLVDCCGSPHTEIAGLQQKFFWCGFEDFDRRLKQESGQHRLLKIKDWPQHATFAEIMPDHYKDLMQALPFNSYSNMSGSLNMVTYMPKFFNPPDLGPKMYIAYGSSGQPKYGTTNLHLDISDAVNVIVYVGKPEGEGAEEALKAARDELARLDLDAVTKDRLAMHETPGALWQIYKRDDSGKIRDFIQKIWKEREVDNNHDPIHAQSEYLCFDLRARLKKEYGVEAFDIVQFEGDAIFIPAGTPHQVWNIHSCIKLAEDFVSPENTTTCLELTEEFRRLPGKFANKADKLQLKSIVFHALNTFCHSLGRTPPSLGTT